ncbi:MAG: RHS repeat protein, partial [Acidobacteria bacterium]|nr:RHS repeat protein [Acidobacteriota bacterium]
DFPDGVTHAFGAAGNLVQMDDDFGNWVQVTYRWVGPKYEMKMADSHGRESFVYYENRTLGATTAGGPQQVLTAERAKLAHFGGTFKYYFFQYEEKLVELPSPYVDLSSAPRLVNPAPMTFLTRVVMPGGTAAFDMSFTGDPATDGYLLSRDQGSRQTGVLQRLRLPTQGIYHWDWTLYRFPSGSLPDDAEDGEELLRGNSSYFTSNVGVAAKHVLDPFGSPLHSWHYFQELLGTVLTAQASRTTVTDPEGHETRHYFSTVSFDNSYGLPFSPELTDGADRYLSREVYDGGDLIRQVYVRYENDVPDAYDGYGSRYNLNRRKTLDRTYAVENGLRTDYTQTRWSDFDGLGNLRRAEIHGNFNDSSLRVEYRNYNPGQKYPASWTPLPGSAPWVLGTYVAEWEVDQGSSARRLTCFDGLGRRVRSRVLKKPMDNDSNYDNDGDPDDVLVTYAYDGRGFLFSESYYGGDSQHIHPTSLHVCGMELPTEGPVYEIRRAWQYGSLRNQRYIMEDGSELRTKDFEIDLSTGWISSSKDQGQLKTDYTYDLYGRVTGVHPEAAHGGPWTSIWYAPASSPSNLAAMGVDLQINGGGSNLSAKRYYFDGLGRLEREQGWVFSQPNAIATSYSYDGLGRRTGRSEAWDTVTQSGPQHWTVTSYDALGRVVRIRPPEGPQHDVTSAYNGLRESLHYVNIATGHGGTGPLESGATTVRRFDPRGRLWQVVEPGSGAVARYAYDVGGRLSSVRLLTEQVSQVERLFEYDNRGFLLSESHPESGTKTYLEHDALGHTLRTADGVQDLSFSYDRAERLLTVADSFGGRLHQELTYGATNSGANRRRGKVVTAVRHNYIKVPWTSPPVEADVTVTESYVYAGQAGLPSARTTALSTGQVFTQGWTYDVHGQVGTLHYPRCVHGACTADSPGPARNVVYARGFGGQLRSISGYAFYTYHPSGMRNSLIHTNGVTDWIDEDAYGRPRPANIRITGAAGEADLGVHAYDGAGNLAEKRRASEYEAYTYDAVGRLRSYRTTTGGVQTYAYDPFGNMTAVGGLNARSMSVDSTTNRLQSVGGAAVAYDAAGSLTQWNGAGGQT